MRVLFSATVPKEPERPESNEDRFAHRLAYRRWALCDGASESFASRTWARIVALMFVADPAIDVEWIDRAIQRFASQFDQSEMSWSKAAAYERGSFSTLLGVEWDDLSKLLDIVAIGDTAAFLCSGGTVMESFPYTTVDDFNQNPLLLGTSSHLNKMLTSQEEIGRRIVWRPLDHVEPSVILATDAIAAWILAAPLDRAAKVLALGSVEQLEQLVLEARASRQMRIDDTTVVILGPK